MITWNSFNIIHLINTIKNSDIIYIYFSLFLLNINIWLYEESNNQLIKKLILVVNHVIFHEESLFFACADHFCLWGFLSL